MHSLRTQVAILAHELGYRVDGNGDVVSSAGNKRKVRDDNRGYSIITVRADRLLGERSHPKNVGVHKLAAYQKFGEKAFQGGIQVRHLNGNKKDNRLENIEIGTPKQNVADIPEGVRSRSQRAATEALCRKKRPGHLAIISDRAKGMTYKQLMKKYSKSYTAISYALNRSRASKTA